MGSGDGCRRPPPRRGAAVAALLAALVTTVGPAVLPVPESVGGLLGARSRPSVTLGPFLRDPLPGGITVVWETDVPTLGGVVWEEPDGTRRRLEEGSSRWHAVEVTGLDPSVSCPYRILVDGEEREGGILAGAPRPDAAVRIVAFGDTRKYHDSHAAVVEGILAEAPDLLLHTGDMVHVGGDMDDWRTFFRIEGDLLRDVPLVPAFGNHEKLGGGVVHFARLFGALARTRSLDFGSVHVVVLDTYGDIPLQARWLRTDLEAASRNPDIRFIVAILHHGPYGTGQFGGNRKARLHFAPLLREFGALVVSGHEHDYERGEVEGLPFLVTGGGGAVLGRRRCDGGDGGDRDDGGRGSCPLWSRRFVADHHYVAIEVRGGRMEVCPRYPEGVAVEDCITYRSPRGEQGDGGWATGPLAMVEGRFSGTPVVP